MKGLLEVDRGITGRMRMGGRRQHGMPLRETRSISSLVREERLEKSRYHRMNQRVYLRGMRQEEDMHAVQALRRKLARTILRS